MKPPPGYGALLLFAGTYLHPMSADPNVPLAAFMEYAADQHWVSSHLMQFSGIALMVADSSLQSTLNLDVNMGRFIDAATERYPAVVLGESAARAALCC